MFCASIALRPIHPYLHSTVVTGGVYTAKAHKGVLAIHERLKFVDVSCFPPIPFVIDRLLWEIMLRTSVSTPLRGVFRSARRFAA